jgi:hypothetical protein
MISFLPSDQVKEIIFDFKDNVSPNYAYDGKDETISKDKSTGSLVMKFLDSIHSIFFVSAIIVFISIIPATLKNSLKK